MVVEQKQIHRQKHHEVESQKGVNNKLARSKWKLVYFSPAVWRKILFLKRKKFLRKKRIIYSRASAIPQCLIGYNVKIHKGKRCRILFLHHYIVGYKFGEFSFSRKPFHYPLRKSLKRKNFFFRK